MVALPWWHVNPTGNQSRRSQEKCIMEIRKSLRWLLIQVVLHAATCAVYQWIVAVW